MSLLLYLTIFFAITGPSSATYCICKDGLGDSALQKTIDYACGAGADCTAILQNGACYQPNTVKDHCNYAANSYFQRKGQASGSCDFSGTATPSATPPANVVTGCTFPSSASNTGTTNGTTTGTTTGTATGTTTGTPSIYGGSTTGLGPTGTSISDPSDAMPLVKSTGLFVSALLVSLLGLLLMN